MSLLSSLASKFGYIRYNDGSHFYQLLKGNTNYLGGKDNLNTSLSNPIVASCMQIRANMLSKVQFYQEGANDEKILDSPELLLINNPNPTQSKQDFLIQYEYYRLAYGWVYQKPYGSVGMKTDAIFNLNPKYIEFPDKMQSGLIWSKEDIDKFYEQKFIYEEPEQSKRNIELNDVIMFFDTANGLTDCKTSSVTAPSRLSSVIKSVSNTGIALDAENVILQTNGRELFSQDTKGSNLGIQQTMDGSDRQDIERKLLNKHYVGNGGNRSIVTNKPIDWTNISMDMKDLGFKDSLATNSNLITQMYQVPNEIYKAFMQGATFENQKEAMIGMYQNVIQPVADDLASTWSDYFELSNPIKASFEHLPVMQFNEQRKADKILKIATAYEKLVRAGVETNAIEELFDSQGVPLN